MKYRFILLFILAIALTACGSQTAQLSPSDQQATATANAASTVKDSRSDQSVGWGFGSVNHLMCASRTQVRHVSTARRCYRV